MRLIAMGALLAVLSISSTAAHPATPRTLSFEKARAVTDVAGRHLFHTLGTKRDGMIAPTGYRPPRSRSCTRVTTREVLCPFAIIYTGLPHGESQTCNHQDRVRLNGSGQTMQHVELLNCETRYPPDQ